MQEVTRLASVTEDEGRPTSKQAYDGAWDDLTAVVLEVTTAAVVVERTHDDGREPMRPKCGAGVGLTGELASAVDRFRPGGMSLVHRCTLSGAEHFTRGDVDEATHRTMPRRLDKAQSSGCIDIVVLLWPVQTVSHPEASKVEHDIRSRTGRADSCVVSNVTLDEMHSPVTHRCREVLLAAGGEVVEHP